MHSDFLDLLRLLNAHKVRYLVIGGYAYSLHVEPRQTKDIDLWVEASILNGRRLLKALSEFGAPTDNLSEADFAKPGLLYIFGVPPLRVDMLNRVKGRTFHRAYAGRATFKFEGVAVPVVGRQDLIRLKRAAGRPQDLADLEKLGAGAARKPRGSGGKRKK